MCSSKDIEFRGSMYRRARRFYITRPWSMNINPITLSWLFEKVSDSRTDRLVNIGTHVHLLDPQENQLCDVQIVTPQDSRPAEGKISFLSPLGAALMEARPEDTISISVLGGVMKFKILRVD